MILVNLSGRGDKDVETAAAWFGAARRRAGDRREPRSPRRFARTRAEGRAALVGYLPAGYPSVDGCDRRDARDGRGRRRRRRGRPALQRPGDGRPDDPGGRRAGAARGGVGIADVLRAVDGGAPTPGPPPLVMTYWNPVERYGVDAFAADLAAAGGAGVDHAGPHPGRGRRLARGHATRTASTGSSWSRRRRPTSGSRDGRGRAAGFVYAASTMGVTGARDRGRRRGAERWSRGYARGHRPAGRASGSACPTGDQAAEVAAFADGVIVGSAFVRLLLDAPDAGRGVAAVRALAAELPRAYGRPRGRAEPSAPGTWPRPLVATDVPRPHPVASLRLRAAAPRRARRRCAGRVRDRRCRRGLPTAAARLGGARPRRCARPRPARHRARRAVRKPPTRCTTRTARPFRIDRGRPTGPVVLVVFGYTHCP